MSLALSSNVIIFGLVLLIILIVIQVLLSTRRNIILGFILPIIFLITVGYNLYMEFFIYNPNPTMKRGFYEALGITGFLISLIIMIISRMIIKRHQR